MAMPLMNVMSILELTGVSYRILDYVLGQTKPIKKGTDGRT
jgi:hypothetical protein